MARPIFVNAAGDATAEMPSSSRALSLRSPTPLATIPPPVLVAPAGPAPVNLGTPVNPNVGAGGSPEAQAFRAQAAANMGPQPPAGLRAAPAGPVGVSPAALGERAGMAVGQGVNTVIARAPQITDAVKAAGARAGKFAVGNANGIGSTINAFAPHVGFYDDEKVPLTDKLRVGASDAIHATATGLGGAFGGAFGGAVGSAVAPGVGTVAGGIAGGVGGSALGSKVGRWAGTGLTGADDVMRRNGYDPERTLMDVGGDMLAGKGFGTGKPTVPGAAPDPVATLRAPTGAGAGRGFVNPPLAGSLPVAPLPPENPNGVITRNGNNFSGENIREGFSYKDARTGQVTTPEQRVTTLPAGTMGALDPALAQRLHEAKMGALDRGESLGPGGMTTIGSSGGLRGSDGSDIQRLVESGKLTASGLNGLLTARGQDIGAQTTTRGQDIGAQTAMRGQDVQGRGQDLQHDATLRGQDVQMAGHLMSTQVARAQARMQQMQQDRQYGLEVAKFGEEKAKSAFTQRQQSAKDLQGRFEGELIDPATGKADPNRVAEHMGAVNSFVSDAIAKAEAVPKGAPGYAEAQAMAEKLRSEGVKAVGEDRLQQITLGLKAKHLNAQNSSPYNPFMGSQVDSSNPDDYRIKAVEKNTLTPDMYIHRNGARTPVNVLDRVGGSPVMNVGKARTTQFDPLKGAR